ncbi:MAG: type II toxin-antitoxin system VapC family toxin [Thermomicrobiales bacterium]
MIILDTNVISALMEEHKNPIVTEWVLRYEEQNLWLTSTSVAEILFGIAIMPRGKRRAELALVAAMILERFDGRILSFEEGSAILFAGITAERRKRGLSIEVEDGQIAAICRQHGATLATRNTKDFLHTGVELVNPWDVDGIS